MRTIFLTILLLVNIHANDCSKQQQCHLDGWFVVCGEERKEIVVDTTIANWMKRDDDPKHQLGVFLRYPKDATGPGWEEYFILDYKNMMVYDNECLGGNFAFARNSVVYFYKFDHDGKIVFKKQDFDHCKQPLKEWLKKPYNPY